MGVCQVSAQSQDPVQNVLANFERLDLDGDGAISRAEFREVQLARWLQIDRNGDGFLTVDDFPSIAADRAKAQLAGIAYLDTDGDGQFSQSEFVDGEAPLFRRADRNGDGVLTRAELEMAAQ
ncbi:EF-hand domain-containing protein [Pannonibacter sp.]|uniref:EF-hand domain-containing protein n=1 Tax=Pannonibacter sp. TaxID=1906786 RepID=UPI003F6E65B1